MTKREVRKEIFIMSEGSAKDFITEMQEWMEKAEKSGYTNIRVSIDTEQELYSDDRYAKVCLTGVRLETDEEYKARMDEEEQIRAHRRRAYEHLKKEFGDA